MKSGDVLFYMKKKSSNRYEIFAFVHIRSFWVVDVDGWLGTYF